MFIELSGMLKRRTFVSKKIAMCTFLIVLLFSANQVFAENYFKDGNVYGLGGGNVDSIDFADFDEDGYMDMIVCKTNNSVYLMKGNSDGTFDSSEIVASFSGRGIMAADFNNDGHMDFVYGSNAAGYNESYGNVFVYLGDGNGGFTRPSSVQGSSDISFPKSFAPADLNGDGILDLAVACYGSGSISGSLAIFIGNDDGLGKGDGTFTLTANITDDISYAQSVETADLDHDGDMDIVLHQYTDGIKIFENDGAGTFTSVQDVNCKMGVEIILVI